VPALYDLYLQHRDASERRQRLFAVACCRRVLTSPLLDLAELRADERIDAVEHEEAASRAYLLYQAERERPAAEFSRERLMAARAVLMTLGGGFYHALDAAEYARQSLPAPHGQAAVIEAREEAEQCALFQEIFGPKVFIDPLWRVANDHAVEHLAELAYTEKAWELLPVLADALEDAGCEDTTLLEHLRHGGPHVRGCWALDAILGQT
jgi:hypothetical protein